MPSRFSVRPWGFYALLAAIIAIGTGIMAFLVFAEDRYQALAQSLTAVATVVVAIFVWARSRLYGKRKRPGHSPTDRPIVAEVEVFERNTGKPSAHTQPSRVSVHAWEIFPVPIQHDSYDAYLVKVNYDIWIPEPLRRMQTISVEFTCHEAIIADAIPRQVTHPRPAQNYELTSALNFAPTSEASAAWGDESPLSLIPLPSQRPILEVYGIGGSVLTWRHEPPKGGTAAVGSHTGWIALKVKPGTTLVNVRADVDYSESDSAGHETKAQSLPDEILISLPRDGSAEPSTSASRRIVIAIDIVGYSGYMTSVQLTTQRIFMALLDSAARRAGIGDLGSIEQQGTGDGIFLMMPIGIGLESVSEFLDYLIEDAGRTEGSSLEYSPRLRVSISSGVVFAGANGFVGNTVIEAARLIDSQPLRQAMAEQRGRVGIILSDTFYGQVSEFDIPGISLGDFYAVDVAVKSYQARAWIRVAG